MVEQRLEKFFNMSAGLYCGVLLRENLAKKMMKLLYKQSQEVQELLAQNIDDVECHSWTVVYPKGEQTAIDYFQESSLEDKMKRIKLFDKAAELRYCANGVFSTNEHWSEAANAVKAFYAERYGNDEPKKEESIK